MPQKTNNKRNHRPSHRQTRDYLKVYWPYLPLALIVITGLILGLTDPRLSKKGHASNGVLSYASEMSSAGLLAATNTRRSENGKAALSQSALLSQAAQNKANDMVARDYWSHVTPDGKQPWDFMQAVGYQFQKAGENLAYGFATSADTVTGWMNSPSHKANMLDSAFTEVGFGFANSSNYQNTGPETVVVAMYGLPLVATTPSPPPPSPQSAPISQPKTAPATTPTPTQPVPTTANNSEEIPTETPSSIQEKASEETPINSDASEQIILESPNKSVSRVQVLTSGNAPWSASIIVGSAILCLGLWLSHHALRFRKIILKGERFILHHPIMDVTMVAFMGLVLMLNHSIGFIK